MVTPATSGLALGLLRSWVKAITCEVSRPMMPARSGFLVGSSAIAPPARRPRTNRAGSVRHMGAPPARSRFRVIPRAAGRYHTISLARNHRLTQELAYDRPLLALVSDTATALSRPCSSRRVESRGGPRRH